MNPTVQQLVDRAAIQDVHVRYFQGLDSVDLMKIKSCFTPDVYALYEGQAPITGVDELAQKVFEPFLAAVRAGTVKVGTHFMGNLAFNRLEGDVAETETYVFSLVVRHNPGKETVAVRCLRYLDRLRRDSQGWRICERAHVSDWTGSMTAEQAGTFAQRITAVPNRP